MPVPNTIADLNQSAALNSPLGSETVGPNLDDYVRAGFAFARQLFDGTPHFLTSVSGTNTVTASCSVPFTAYVTGQVFRFVPAVSNTGAVTLNVNGLGTKAITKNGAAALTGNELVAGTLATVAYDGTQFQLLGVTTAAPGNSPYSFRNKLMNPLFIANQRNYVAGAATTAPNQYTRDRWRVVVSGQSVNYTPTGNGFVAAAPVGGFEQVIEGVNIEGGTYFLNWSGTATATVNGAAVAKGGAVVLTANADTTVRFSNGTVLQPQFELGGITPFEIRPYGLEFAMCQRYYVELGVGASGVLYSGAVFTATSGFIVLPFVMRSTPTLVGGTWSITSASGTPVTITTVTSAFRGVLLQTAAGAYSPGPAYLTSTATSGARGLDADF